MGRNVDFLDAQWKDLPPEEPEEEEVDEVYKMVEDLRSKLEERDANVDEETCDDE